MFHGNFPAGIIMTPARRASIRVNATMFHHGGAKTLSEPAALKTTFKWKKNNKEINKRITKRECDFFFFFALLFPHVLFIVSPTAFFLLYAYRVETEAESSTDTRLSLVMSSKE